MSDQEDYIDLRDDHDYQVLSAVLETDDGENVAEILSKVQKDIHQMTKDVHLLASSVKKLIDYSFNKNSSENKNKNTD